MAVAEYRLLLLLLLLLLPLLLPPRFLEREPEEFHISLCRRCWFVLVFAIDRGGESVLKDQASVHVCMLSNEDEEAAVVAAPLYFRSPSDSRM